MTTLTRGGKDYMIPDRLTEWQQDMYVHLINWKWRNITREPGIVRDRQDRAVERDAFLPERYHVTETWPHLYSDIVPELKRHRLKNAFKIHPDFYHMVSSQAANINLFLPLLTHPRTNEILSKIKPDLKALATDQLDHGYCLEYWGGNFGDRFTGDRGKGLLNDKSKAVGTDADIAIAYENLDGELCLWLVEHKLTEPEFTECGGCNSWKRQKRKANPKSRGWKRLSLHDCERTFAEILNQKEFCHYHDICNYNYWRITERHASFFLNHASFAACPFRGGMNQLRRNQLLAFAIEDEETSPFKHVYFSVVRHPENRALDGTLEGYARLTGREIKDFAFTSADVAAAASTLHDERLDDWVGWYKELYKLPQRGSQP